MPRTIPPLVIDARPRGPSGPLAGALVLGRPVLDHLLDLATTIVEDRGEAGQPVAIHARLEEHRRLAGLLEGRPSRRFVFLTGSPSEGSAILRADRLYDPARLGRALRRGRDPESAVVWRLDRPQGLAGAEAELIRRQTYQPIGRYWALGPARLLARALRPTRVRPNALTVAAAGLMLAAAAAVAFAPTVATARAAIASALALALVLDTADGHLARLQGTASAFGRWLDAVLDELSDMALHAAIAWAAFARDGRPAWLLLGMAYAMGKYVFLVGTVEGEKGETPAVTSPQPVRPSPLASAVRLAGHADLRWHLWIALAALGRLEIALAAYAAYYPARAIAGAARKAVRHA